MQFWNTPRSRRKKNKTWAKRWNRWISLVSKKPLIMLLMVDYPSLKRCVLRTSTSWNFFRKNSHGRSFAQNPMQTNRWKFSWLSFWSTWRRAWSDHHRRKMKRRSMSTSLCAWSMHFLAIQTFILFSYIHRTKVQTLSWEMKKPTQNQPYKMRLVWSH